MLTSIVAIDGRGAIGCRNELPWKLKTDMQFFRSKTVGNTVIMGRKTYDSIGGCLPRRTNIVLSHNNVLFADSPSCQLALSIEESLYRAHLSSTDEIFIVGGALTYSQFAPLVDRYLVTIVDHLVPDADAYLDKSILSDFESWGPKLLSTKAAEPSVDEYDFSIYEIKAPDSEKRREQRLKLIEKYNQAFSKPKLQRVKASSTRAKQDAFAF